MDEQERIEFYKKVDNLEGRMGRVIPEGTPAPVVIVALGRMMARIGVGFETTRQAVEKVEGQSAKGSSAGDAG